MKTTNFIMRLSDEEKEDLKECAKLEGVSMSEYLIICKEFYEERKDND